MNNEVDRDSRRHPVRLFSGDLQSAPRTTAEAPSDMATSDPERPSFTVLE